MLNFIPGGTSVAFAPSLFEKDFSLLSFSDAKHFSVTAITNTLTTGFGSSEFQWTVTQPSENK